MEQNNSVVACCKKLALQQAKIESSPVWESSCINNDP